MSDADKITVHITCSQRVRYSQFITMTRQQWEALKATPERDLADDDGDLSGWLDLSYVADGDDFDDIEMVVVDEATSKPVMPRDEYEGGAQ